MHVELNEARLKQMAKTLRTDLGSAAPSYQHTLDLLAKMLGYRSYEAMKPSLADTTAASALPGLAPHGMLAALWIDRHDRPDWVETEPLILLGSGRSAVEAALHGWLDAVGSSRTIEDQTHHIEMLPVHVRQDAGSRPVEPLEEVFVAVVEWGDRPDDGTGPLLTIGHDRRAAEAALARKLGNPADLPPHRVFSLQVHRDPRRGTVGRRGEALPAQPTGQPANLLLANSDPVMDGTRLYDRPTYYECGICGALHPADWNGDCRDDNNRFDPEQLDARHGENGWDEIDMPGSEDASQQVDLTHPRRGTAIAMRVCQLPDDGLIEAASRRLRDDHDAFALQFTYVPVPADPDEEPRWFVRRLDARGLDDPARAEPEDGLHPEEAALTPTERNSLVYLQKALAFGADTAITVHVDRYRTVAFPTAGDPGRYTAFAAPIEAVALYQFRDDQQSTLNDGPRQLIELIQDLEEMA